MEHTAENQTQTDLCIAVLAPTGRDGKLICEFLKSRNFACRCWKKPDGFFDRLGDCTSTGIAVITSEALNRAEVDQLTALLENQPSWSSLPVLILTPEKGIRPDLNTLSVKPGVNFLPGRWSFRLL